MIKSISYTLVIFGSLFLIVFLFFKSCVIYNPQPKECTIVTAKITELRAGPTFDIGFTGDQGDTYYINRGIESGLNLDSLKKKVLNKTVTLHLPNMTFGPSKHIAQLALGDEILYTEFD